MLIFSPLSGLEIGLDIEIVYTGLLPGEKLSEKLSGRNEEPGFTEHEKIQAIFCDQIPLYKKYAKELENLINLA